MIEEGNTQEIDIKLLWNSIDSYPAMSTEEGNTLVNEAIVTRCTKLIGIGIPDRRGPMILNLNRERVKYESATPKIIIPTADGKYFSHLYLTLSCFIITSARMQTVDRHRVGMWMREMFRISSSTIWRNGPSVMAIFSNAFIWLIAVVDLESECIFSAIGRDRDIINYIQMIKAAAPINPMRTDFDSMFASNPAFNIPKQNWTTPT